MGRDWSDSSDSFPHDCLGLIVEFLPRDKTSPAVILALRQVSKSFRDYLHHIRPSCSKHLLFSLAHASFESEVTEFPFVHRLLVWGVLRKNRMVREYCGCFPEVRALTLDQHDFIEGDFVIACPKLQHLESLNCGRVVSANFRSSADLPCLQSLTVDMGISKRGISGSILRFLPNLLKLVLYSPFDHFTDSHFEDVGDVLRLQKLVVYGPTGLSSRGISFVGGSLLEVDFERCVRLDKSFLYSLSSIEDIRVARCREISSRDMIVQGICKAQGISEFTGTIRFERFVGLEEFGNDCNAGDVGAAFDRLAQLRS